MYLVFGNGYSLNTTLVTTPRVPSEPIKSCFKSYPELSFISFFNDEIIVPSGRTASIPITKLRVIPYLKTLKPPAFVDIAPPIWAEPLAPKFNGRSNVFFIHGGVDTEDREKVREITEQENNAIIVASYGTFSTGINIKNLHNIIFASPSKSRIRNLQSIGRVLRKGNQKTKATLYDIADDISSKSRKNYTLNHLIERIKIYNEEKFNYDIVNIPIKK